MIDEKKLIEVLEELEEEHPYKEYGNPETYHPYNEAWTDCIDRTISIIENFRKEGEWILVSERLPKEYVDVLCCNAYTEIMIGEILKDKASNTGFSADGDGGFIFDVVAWMPLPEPYKGEEE